MVYKYTYTRVCVCVYTHSTYNTLRYIWTTYSPRRSGSSIYERIQEGSLVFPRREGYYIQYNNGDTRIRHVPIIL